MNLSSVSLILFVFCVGISSQQFFDWISDNVTENNNPSIETTKRSTITERKKGSKCVYFHVTVCENGPCGHTYINMS